MVVRHLATMVMTMHVYILLRVAQWHKHFRGLGNTTENSTSNCCSSDTSRESIHWDIVWIYCPITNNNGSWVVVHGAY